MKSLFGMTLNTQKKLAFVFILIGVFLLIYMVLVEDEPGAVPLLVLAAGIIWLNLLNRHLRKQELSKKRFLI